LIMIEFDDTHDSALEKNRFCEAVVLVETGDAVRKEKFLRG